MHWLHSQTSLCSSRTANQTRREDWRSGSFHQALPSHRTLRQIIRELFSTNKEKKRRAWMNVCTRTNASSLASSNFLHLWRAQLKSPHLWPDVQEIECTSKRCLSPLSLLFLKCNSHKRGACRAADLSLDYNFWLSASVREGRLKKQGSIQLCMYFLLSC